MTDAPGPLDLVLREVGYALEPLSTAIQQTPVPSGLAALLVDAGVEAGGPGTSADELVELCTDLAPLVAIVEALVHGDAIPAPEHLGPALEQVFSALRALGATPGDAAGAAGESLVAYLLTDLLRRKHRLLYASMLLMGMMWERPENTEGPPPRLDPGRLPRLVGDVNNLMAEAYGWGTPQFAIRRLLEHLQGVALALGFPAIADLAGLADHPGLSTVPSVGVPPALRIALTTIGTGDDAAEAGISVLPIHDDAQPFPGFAIAPFAIGNTSDDIDLGDNWHLVITASGDLQLPFGVIAYPGELSVGTIDEVTHPVKANVRIEITRSEPAEESHTLIGDPAGTRFEVGTLGLALEIAADPFDFGISIAGRQWRIVVQAGANDGFLATILPQKGLSLPFDMTIGWSHKLGLYVVGGAGLRWTIPTAIDVGPVHISTASLALTAAVDRPGDPTTLRFSAALSADVTIGPFSAAINEVGVLAQLAIGAATSDVGVGKLALRPKPPTGIGLAIATPAVSGGGFLLFDADAGRYAGVFELTIANTISVKAIALITTKLPDGSPGFSLLVLITAEGFTPIPLGLGFSLTGIGGLLALNRTVNPDVVRDGLRDGVLDSVLFVKDPVKNANRVLTTLDKVFPRAADRLVVGPLVEITWGTPPIVKIRAAVLLDLPQPIKVVLLAALSMLLPRPEDAVVEIHIDAIGVLDLGRGELALDASLHDSRILTFTLTGDMALRLNWGSDPIFLFSVGGWHPKFTPPQGMRPLNRLALTLSESENPRVRFEAYLALTSNTIQMGARVQVYAEEAGFGIDGGGSFDALIQWSPFALDVALGAWVRVFSPAGTLLALTVALEVTGPRPWHVTGQASVQLLCVSAKVGIDVLLGPTTDAPDPVQTIDVATELWSQISALSNWDATLPTDVTPGVTLIDTASSEAGAPAAAHPLAAITVRQRIAPLDTSISKIGAAVPTLGTRSYSLDADVAKGITVDSFTDMFAPAQYNDVPDEARISEPSFVPLQAGITLRPTATADTGPGLGSALDCETLDVTALDTPARPGPRAPAVMDLAVPAHVHTHPPQRHQTVRALGRIQRRAATSGHS